MPKDIDRDEEKKDKQIDSSLESTAKDDGDDSEVANNGYIEINEKISDKTSKDISKKDPPIMLISKKGTRKRRARKKKGLDYDSEYGDIICEDIIDTDIDEDMCGVVDENIPLRPGITIAEWSFV
ncbi:hypothetical protein [Clostridium folliculivorans]|uniref:Uncharacterized protein n=1 Tax=Clostridium folliculivorans TaxID=2886038 RepID=A0A9W5Y757_9CLOT|nr:hypothetical protein [Clostridium folliculivorans]GKU27851.1 hypothetical protein CFOLD11_46780 [Clostridium folliculivorans]GKU32598.1 hypothetical protein CFB3_47060 [Clostridium folliculivorans]